jgi:hypothetical protein
MAQTGKCRAGRGRSLYNAHAFDSILRYVAPELGWR